MQYRKAGLTSPHGQPKRNTVREPADYTFSLTAQGLFTIGHLKGRWEAYNHYKLSPLRDMNNLEELDQEMWRGMDSDTDEDTLRQCLLASESSLAETWDDPEEDEAWADL